MVHLNGLLWLVPLLLLGWPDLGHATSRGMAIIRGMDVEKDADRGKEENRRRGHREFSRSGFMVGFSVGGAHLRINPVEGLTDSEGGLLLTFDIGGVIRNRLGLMLRFSGASRYEISTGPESDAAVKLTTLISRAIAGRIFLPHDVHITVGLGLGELSVQSEKTATTDRGFGYLVDVGKEWPQSKHFVLGAELSHAGQVLDGGTSFVTGAAMSLRWYWPGRS